MHKRFFTVIALLFAALPSFAVGKYNEPFRGLNNIVRKQNLVLINRLQAVAEYNDLQFTKLWPSEYFSNDGKLTFFYYGENEGDSLDIIKFDVLLKDKNCEHPYFCRPVIIADKVSYRYEERMIRDYIPDFINYPKNHVVSEILLDENSGFEVRELLSNLPEEKKATLPVCHTGNNGVTKVCTVNDADGQLLYREEIFAKNPAKPLQGDNLLKYIKYDAFGRKIMEYVYSKNKLTSYDENGEVTEEFRLTEDSFLYYNSKLPSLYIDLSVKRNEQGYPVEETYYERGAIPVRKYLGVYKDNVLEKVFVYDMFKKDAYEVIPFPIQNVSAPKFKIRY